MSQDPETQPESPVPAPAPADALWARMVEDVRARFPKASEGIAFCILKLEQNPDQRLRDFQAEAALHGLKVTGRAYHSARVALGLDAPVVRRARVADAEPAVPTGSPAAAPEVGPEDGGESPAIAALLAFERSSTQELERLRVLLRSVRDIVDEALAD